MTFAHSARAGLRSNISRVTREVRQKNTENPLGNGHTRRKCKFFSAKSSKMIDYFREFCYNS